MSRSLRLVFVSAAAFFVLLPLAVPRPGMPPTLKADEPAYYLAALSLIHDGDLRCETVDLRRLFDQYPHLPVDNLILMSSDGWETARFGKPYLYSLLIAPFAALFDARGAVAFNMVLFLAMIWMGYRTLSRYNEEGLAASFAAAFFFLSPAFVYVFWLQPEVLNMFGVAACLYLGLAAGGRERQEGAIRGRMASFWAFAAGPAGSASALSLAVYNKPMFAVLGLPVLWSLWRRRGWRATTAWLAAAILSMAAIAGLSILWSDTPTAYLGAARAGVKIEDPERLEQTLAPLVTRSQRALERDEAPLASFGWLIRVPELFPRLLKENLGYFLWGRHTGLLLYMPFAGLAVLLFLYNDRRSSERWLVLASVVAVALIFVIWIHYNWHGGSGFIGNRYFVGAYPAFLFLVTRLRPAWSLAVGAVAGALFLGPVLFTPYGAPVPDPTLQAHARGAAFEVFPTELSVRTTIPGYETMTAHGVAFRARQDLVDTPSLGSGSLWVRGAFTTEIWAIAAEPLDSLLFEVSSLAPDNEVRLAIGGARETVSFAAAEGEAPQGALVELTPRRESKLWYQYGKRVHAYRLMAGTKTGRNPRRPDGGLVQPQFYVGAQLTYLGTRADLENKVYYRLRWGETTLPEKIAAGERFELPVAVQNRTTEAWPAEGVLAVALTHRWLDPEGRPVGAAVTTPLPRRVNPGSWSQPTLAVKAPAQEGAYILEIDAVREGLTRFSERGTQTLRLEAGIALSK